MLCLSGQTSVVSPLDPGFLGFPMAAFVRARCLTTVQRRGIVFRGVTSPANLDIVNAHDSDTELDPITSGQDRVDNQQQCSFHGRSAPGNMPQ